METYLEERQLDAFILKERSTGNVQYVPRVKHVETSSILKRRSKFSPLSFKDPKNNFSVSTASTVSAVHENEQEESPNDLQMSKFMAEFGDFTHLDASIKHARKSEKARGKKSKKPTIDSLVKVQTLGNPIPQKIRKVINLTEEAGKSGIYGIF